MMGRGRVGKDHNTSVSPSRGYYIVMNERGTEYLHSDGEVKHGVRGPSAFWDTKEKAESFLESWKQNLVCENNE